MFQGISYVERATLRQKSLVYDEVSAMALLGIIVHMLQGLIRISTISMTYLSISNADADDDSSSEMFWTPIRWVGWEHK
jgi:hypothetical protein